MEITQGKHFETKQDMVEVQVARLLRVGSAVAAGLIGTGLGILLLGLSEPMGERLVLYGLIALVLTPVLRVVVAFFVFLWERDLAFAVISLLVLSALGVGMLLGKAL